jgi:hypothetical protein
MRGTKIKNKKNNKYFLKEIVIKFKYLSFFFIQLWSICFFFVLNYFWKWIF